MATIYALGNLFDLVVARFKSESVDIENHFGWREPQQSNLALYNRIVWTPGDPGGNVGDLGAPKFPGSNPRPLASLLERFTIRALGHDPQFPEDERKQYQATRFVYDEWVRAVYKEAHGTFRILSQAWNTDKNERRRAAEIICVCDVQAVIPDRTQATAPVDTEGNISTSVEDVTESTLTA